MRNNVNLVGNCTLVADGATTDNGGGDPIVAGTAHEDVSTSAA